MDQNEVTKHFLVGNTFRQAMMQAQIFVSVARWHELGLCLNQDEYEKNEIWKKKHEKTTVKQWDLWWS